MIVSEKQKSQRYDEEFKRQVVELVIPSAEPRRRSSENWGQRKYSLMLWKRAYLGHLKPAQVGAEQMNPEEMFEKIRQLQKENEYLKQQREILSLVLASRQTLSQAVLVRACTR